VKKHRSQNSKTIRKELPAQVTPDEVMRMAHALYWDDPEPILSENDPRYIKVRETLILERQENVLHSYREN
jgi:hypothetical protein